MLEGTTRADFIYRVMRIRELDIDPDAAKLIEDLHEAFERGFKFAIQLRDTEHFHDMGELLRLELMNEKEEIALLNKTIKERKNSGQHKND